MTLANRKEEAYGDLFTTAQDATKWNDLYEDTSTLFNFDMAERRDRVCQMVYQRYTPESAILDLGCGAGVVMEKLIQHGYKATGVDRSSDMIELSRKRLSSFPSDAYQLEQGTCESLPFEDKQFDVILCIGVFGYIDDVVGALLEIRRVLRPGGLLVMSVRNPYNSAISDPVHAVRMLARKVTNRSQKSVQNPVSTSATASLAADTAPGSPPQFKIDILQKPRPLIEGVTRCGYGLDYFVGFGFGPLTIAKKRLLPHAWNIAISNFLYTIFDRLGLQKISRSIGDVSIYGFIKAQKQ